MQSEPEIQRHTTLCGCNHATRLTLENMRESLVKYTLFRRLWRNSFNLVNCALCAVKLISG